MNTIEYDVKINEDGRLYIHLPDDYDNKPEDKFFVMEIARYFLISTFEKNNNILDDETIDLVSDLIGLLSQLSDEMSDILLESMKNLGNMDMMMNIPYHIKLNTLKELDELPKENIFYNGRIFSLKEGLRVFIDETNEIYKYNEKEWEV